MALNFGRFDMVDLYVKPFTGGEGLDKFMNLAFVAPPMWARTIPPVTEGVIAAFLGRTTEPVVTSGSSTRTTKASSTTARLSCGTSGCRSRRSRCPGVYSVGGEFSSITATSLDQTQWVLIPALDVPSRRRRARGR